MATVKFVLKDDVEAEVIVLRPFLDKQPDGSVVVKVEEERGTTWNLVRLSTSKGVIRCERIPSGLGLPLDARGRLVECE